MYIRIPKKMCSLNGRTLFIGDWYANKVGIKREYKNVKMKSKTDKCYIFYIEEPIILNDQYGECFKCGQKTVNFSNDKHGNKHLFCLNCGHADMIPFKNENGKLDKQWI